MHCSEKKPLLSGSGSTASLEQSRHVGFTPDFGTYRCEAANRRFGPCVDIG